MPKLESMSAPQNLATVAEASHMKKVNPFEYAAAAHARNRHTNCDCDAKREKDAEEKLAQVQRIVAARFPVEAKVITLDRRRK
jgi:hypothetical protein